jgi:zinc protease
VRTSRLLLVLLLAGGSTPLTASCAGAPSKSPLLDGLERRVLPNGLAVVVKEDRRLPAVTAMLAVRVGSVNEDPSNTGLAHFFEHMVFKGTAKYAPGEIDLATYRAGGQNNAHTTHDMTGYWFRVGSAHLDRALDILADTFANSALDPREFERERNTVFQEMNIDLDGPWGKLQTELDKAVYPSSGYGHPILGWREHLEALTPEKMREFYRRHYRPGNASLILVGDVGREDAFRRAQKFFGGIPAGELPPPARADEPPQAAPKVLEVKTPFTADRFIVAYRAEPAGSESDIALDVVSTILADGRTSRLRRRLVDKEGLAGEDGVGANNYSRRREGVFSIQVEMALESPLEKARAIVEEEIEALKRHLVDARELRRAKNLLKARFAFETESQVELVSKIGYFEALGLPDYVERYMDRVEAVDAERIRETARRIFTEKNRTTAVGWSKGRRASLAPRQQGAPPRLSGVVREVLPNGLRVLAVPRRDVPVVAVQVYVQAGAVFEPEAKAGVAALTGDLLDEGIDDGAGRVVSAERLAEEIEFTGGRLWTGATGAGAKVLSEHAGAAFDALRDVIRHPSFEADRVAKGKEDLLAEIEAADDEPSMRAYRLFFKEAYRGHPLSRPSIGSRETMKALTRDDVVAHHRRWFRPENAIVAVAGDLDPARAISEVRARFGDWKGEGAWTAPKPPAATRQSEPRPVDVAVAAQQTRIVMGHVGVARSDPDWTALHVGQLIFGMATGFASRLARQVRDVEGLTYDVSGSFCAGSAEVAAPVLIVLGVEPPDREKALASVRRELEKFLREGPTAREVEDAKGYLLASFTDEWEGTEDLAGYLVESERFGLGPDWPERYFRAVGAVTAESVRAAAARHVDPARLTTVVVGPDAKEKGSK